MNRKTCRTAIVLGMVLLHGACTSSEIKEDGMDLSFGDSDASSSAKINAESGKDAGTDAVPQDTVETTASDTAEPSNEQQQPTEQSTEQTTTPPAEVAGTPASVAEVSPAAAVASVQQPSGASASQVGEERESYTVQEGDTLMKVAFEMYGNVYKWKEIYEANKDQISNPNAIPQGVILKIAKTTSPASIDRIGEKYLIKKGDTLGTISHSVYGTASKWKKIWKNNKQLIRDPNQIFAGFYLYYMSDGQSSPSTILNKASYPPLSLAPESIDDKSAPTASDLTLPSSSQVTSPRPASEQ